MRRYAILFLLSVLLVPHAAIAQVTPAERTALQAQLDQIETDILRTQTNLSEQQKQRQSLERDVSILDSKIKVAQLGIKQRDLTIKQLKQGITEKERGISSLDAKVLAGRESIAQMLRETRAVDDLSLVEVALGGTVSDVMREIDDFGTIQRALGVSFDEIATIRNDLAARKNALQEQQQEEQDLLQMQVLEKNNLKQTEKDKQVLVSAAKGQEKIYQKVIAEKKQTAAQIRAALFALRDTKSVSFGDMYNYAKEASAKTGVRPAVILAILTEESNLGQNVGSGSWRVDMNPTRDAPVFQEICAQLGLDPDSQKVSKKPWYGWGGAMGPAQFIPSTWKQYASRISDMTGQNPPNPWDPRTATFAAAILMMDNGADSQTPQTERLAALRYLAGWKNASKAAYAFYGNDVMALAQKIQSQIDILGS
jgi:membrane-bound lytic murein transglycosylase B